MVTKKSYRKNRIDIFVENKRGVDSLIAVVEIKASDWDSMTFNEKLITVVWEDEVKEMYS